MATISLLIQSERFLNIMPLTGTPNEQGTQNLFLSKWIESFTEEDLSTQEKINQAIEKTLTSAIDHEGLPVDTKCQVICSTQFISDITFLEPLFVLKPTIQLIVLIDFNSLPYAVLQNPIII